MRAVRVVPDVAFVVGWNDGRPVDGIGRSRFSLGRRKVRVTRVFRFFPPHRQAGNSPERALLPDCHQSELIASASASGAPE
jgi:hypothetical protein